jgi:hypothetical protein
MQRKIIIERYRCCGSAVAVKLFGQASGANEFTLSTLLESTMALVKHQHNT